MKQDRSSVGFLQGPYRVIHKVMPVEHRTFQFVASQRRPVVMHKQQLAAVELRSFFFFLDFNLTVYCGDQVTLYMLHNLLYRQRDHSKFPKLGK